MSDNSSPTLTQWSLPARYVAGMFLAVLGGVGILLLLPLLDVLLLAFLIAFLIFIPGRAITRRTRLPYPLTIILLFLLFGFVFICALVNILPQLIESFKQLWLSTQTSYDQLVARLQTYQSQSGATQIAGIPVDLNALVPALRQWIAQPGGAEGAPLLSQIANALSTAAGSLLSFAGQLFSSVAGLIGLLCASAVIAFFMLIDLPVSGGVLSSWVPPQYSREVTLLFAKLDHIWLNFFKAQVLIGCLIGASDFVVLSLWGVPGALPLAIIAGTIGLIPIVGGLLAAIPTIIVCLINGSTRFVDMDHLTFTLLVLVTLLLVNQTIYTFIAPRISGAAVSIPAAAVVVGVMIGIAVAGILGALLVAPTIGSLRLFSHYLLSKIELREPYPDEAAPPPDHLGFFTQMLYVKQPRALGRAKRQ